MREQYLLSVFTDEITPRVRYTFDLLFNSILYLPYQLISDKDEFSTMQGPKLQYAAEGTDLSAAFLPATPLLFEKGIRFAFEPDYKEVDGEQVLFPLDAPNAILPFDLPAMIFYLSSRYEEYGAFQADEMDRFPANESLAYKAGFITRPLLNIWGIRFGKLLKSIYPSLDPGFPEYKFRPTFDIDMAWAYRHRPLWLTVGGIAKDIFRGAWPELALRIRVLLNKQEDPFYVFDYLEHKLADTSAHACFFLLMGDYGRYDKNINPKNKAFRQLIKSLASKYELGIHPSYRSSKEPSLIGEEIRRLKHIIDREIRKSRQHFLRISFPSTYQQLIANGIQEDFSMGFADAVGFRASLATPFQWYDLSLEQVQPLTIYPFMAMDVTLRHYMNLSPETAWEELQKLSRITRSVGGEFCILWHNSSFSEKHGWAEWVLIFEKVLSFARE